MNTLWEDLQSEFYESLSDGLRYAGCEADWNDFHQAMGIIADQAKKLATPGMSEDEVEDNVETILDLISGYSLDNLPSLSGYIYEEIERNAK